MVARRFARNNFVEWHNEYMIDERITTQRRTYRSNSMLSWADRWDRISSALAQLTPGILLLYLGSLGYTQGLPMTPSTAFEFTSEFLFGAGLLVAVSRLRFAPKREKETESSSRVTPTGSTERDSSSMVSQQLWDWATRQDQYSIEQFGTGVVGVGALFFAYGQVSTPALKLLIALIGLGASTTLSMHMYGAREEFYAAKERLKIIDKSLYDELNLAFAWRKSGHSRYLYYSSSRLMRYFTGLVSWAWLAIILYRLSVPFVVPLPLAFPFSVLTAISWILLLAAVFLAVFRKYYTDPHRWSD